MNVFPSNQGKIIAIGGVSRSGKSELARKLASELSIYQADLVILSQDDYCLPVDRLPLIKGRPDWESPASMDWNNYHSAIKDYQSESKMIIVEGIFVFDDPIYAGRYAKEINLSISKQTFLDRRIKEVRWGNEPLWFVEHVWNAFVNRTPSLSENRLMLSGEQEIPTKEVVDFIRTN